MPEVALIQRYISQTEERPDKSQPDPMCLAQCQALLLKRPGAHILALIARYPPQEQERIRDPLGVPEFSMYGKPCLYLRACSHLITLGRGYRTGRSERFRPCCGRITTAVFQ